MYSDGFLAFSFKVVKKNAGERPGTSNYEVLLFSSCHKGRISVANLLVEEKLATPTELPKLSFDVNLPHATVFLEVCVHCSGCGV